MDQCPSCTLSATPRGFENTGKCPIVGTSKVSKCPIFTQRGCFPKLDKATEYVHHITATRLTDTALEQRPYPSITTQRVCGPTLNYTTIQLILLMIKLQIYMIRKGSFRDHITRDRYKHFDLLAKRQVTYTKEIQTLD